MAVRTPLGADPSGPDLITHVNERVKSLFDASRLPLTDVAGTGDAVTATLDPDLDGDGLVDGMTFGITWGAANTGGVTLAINGGSAVPVLDAEGLALAPDALADGLRSTLEYVGGDFRILSTMGGDASFGRYTWVLTASGTWTAPDLPDDTPVFVEGWGGGGGGGTGGGGGGAYAARMLRLGDIAPSVTYTIGDGGSGSGTGGSNTTFGSFLTAYGGGGGLSSGGGGGGTNAAGSQGTGAAAAGGFLGGGVGGASGTNPGGDATASEGGGGGGVGAGAAGGRAVFGGGGGAQGAGGASKYAGNGGTVSVAGTAPAGGGGVGAAGARGEIRIWI